MASTSPLPSSAKAVQMSRTGGVEVLEVNDVPVPAAPGPGQLLVRNRFAGVNYIDTYFRTGLYKNTTWPMTFGREAAGEVVAAAADASPSFAPGTRVVYLAQPPAGTYAEYSAVDAAHVAAVPEGLALDKAAAVLLQGLTAWTLIREPANVQPGQWAFVHAAAGGVGLLLVQLLRSVGAKVIGSSSSPEKRELARQNGAEWVLDSRNDDLAARVNDITDGHGIDAVFDGVGKDTFDVSLAMIALKGHLVSFGNASGPVPPVNLLRLSPKNVKLVRPTLYGYVSDRQSFERYTSELFNLVMSDKLNVAIHDVYSLEDAARAHADTESRKTTGKLLIKCS